MMLVHGSPWADQLDSELDMSWVVVIWISCAERK